jgi:sugar/nucleoside kinase (ribokinase family)
LFSFCFVYPDGSGGNLTTNDSVNATVDHALVDEAIPDFREYRGHGIALAAPEAPLAARLHLLELATEYSFYRASSLNSLEITSPEGASILSLTDLLAINGDEAAALTGIAPETMRTEPGVKMAVKAASQYQPEIAVSVTCGKEGSWVWDGHALQHVPAVMVDAVNTAGAGDAHFAGLLVGLAAGLSLCQAHELATLVAALSVLSPHTIHPTLDRASLKALVDRHMLRLNDNIVGLLGGTATQES